METIVPELISALEQLSAPPPSIPWTVEDLAELKRFNQSFGAQGAARRVDALADPDTLCVMTGQQPGILTGPLYTLYKAVGAWVLAEEAERRLGRTVVAGFWIASDDHDFEEMRPVTWLNKDGACVTHETAPKSAPPTVALPLGAISAHAIPMDALDMSALFRHLRLSCHPGIQLTALLDELERFADESQTMEDFFGRCMVRLMGPDTPLVYVSPRLRCIRRVQERVLRRMFSDPRALSNLLEESGRQIAQSEGAAPIVRRPDDVNSFLYETENAAGAPTLRARMAWDGHMFSTYVPQTNRFLNAYAPEEIESLLTNAPERFSPNVVTRPLVQDIRFPTIAYVAGPGEARYFRQLAPIYEYCEIRKPLIIRRPGAVGVEPAIRKGLNALALSLEDALDNDKDALLAKLTLRHDIPALARTESALEEVETVLASLRDDLRNEPPHIAKGARKLSGTVERGFAKLKRRVIRVQSQRDQALADRVQQIQNAIRPEGVEQERILNPFVPFYARYGDEWIATVRAAFAQNFSSRRALYFK